jgi:O-acetyl-ADP-ribose deacetylase (regulator of RNase III)
VIHVVGPIYRDGQDNEALLAQAVRGALDTADRLEAQSIAIPAISAGIYGYPTEEACRIIVHASDTWLADGGRIDEIRLVAFDGETADHFRRALRTLGS